MQSFSGFPQGVRSIPVPAPLLGPLLEDITSMEELKCTLRFLWMIAQKHGQPRTIEETTLLQDQVLISTLGSTEKVKRGLTLAVDRGTLIAVEDQSGKAVYLLNTHESRNGVKNFPPSPNKYKETASQDFEANLPESKLGNVFVLYEENIGMLTPLIADELRDAESIYPESWFEPAFREAVAQNKRNWRYITRILERWATEGRSNGESWRYTETLTAAEYIRQYGLPRKT